MWNYGKLSTKFLVSSLKVIDTVGFLSFFQSFTRTTIKIPLIMYRVFYRSCLWSRDVWDLSEHAEVNMAD